MLHKIPILWKKAWSKSCLELNYLQKKSVDAHVYLSPPPHRYGAQKIDMVEI